MLSVSQGRICSDNFTCCHTEIEVADPTFYLTQSQYTDTGPTSPSADPMSPGAWQGSHWSANFEVTGMTRPVQIPSQAGFEPRTFRSRTRPTRRCIEKNADLRSFVMLVRPAVVRPFVLRYFQDRRKRRGGGGVEREGGRERGERERGEERG